MAEHETTSSEEVPSLEPWLVVALVGFIPLTAAFLIAGDYMSYLIGTGGLFIVASVVMLIRQERQRRRVPSRVRIE